MTAMLDRAVDFEKYVQEIVDIVYPLNNEDQNDWYSGPILPDGWAHVSNGSSRAVFKKDNWVYKVPFACGESANCTEYAMSRQIDLPDNMLDQWCIPETHIYQAKVDITTLRPDGTIPVIVMEYVPYILDEEEFESDACVSFVEYLEEYYYLSDLYYANMGINYDGQLVPVDLAQ